MLPPRPWDRPSRSYLMAPSAESHYMSGNSPLAPSTQVNSSSNPVLLNQMPASNRPTPGVSAPPPPPPRTNVPRRVRRLLPSAAAAVTGYDSSMGYNGYGRYGAMSHYGAYGGYGGYRGYNGYGSYGGYSGYGGYGMYGGYGNYGLNRPANPNDPEGQFIRLAEESSRPAFQSIESLVQAFHSVSIMLDSTLTAVHTLFRAVLGMADNFGRMRSLLKQFFGSIALFRLFMWTYRKLLYLVGIRNNPNREEIWQSAAAELGTQITRELGVNPNNGRSSWPILLFLGIVLTGPYLILKFISSLNPQGRRTEDESAATWNPVSQPGHLRIALYDYTATSEDELSFRTGQRIIVAPANLQQQGSGWLLACAGTSPQIGLVPSNYVAKPRLPGQLRSVPNQAAQSAAQVNQSDMPAADATAVIAPGPQEVPHQAPVLDFPPEEVQLEQELLSQAFGPTPQLGLPEPVPGTVPISETLPAPLTEPLPVPLPEPLPMPLPLEPQLSEKNDQSVDATKSKSFEDEL